MGQRDLFLQMSIKHCLKVIWLYCWVNAAVYRHPGWHIAVRFIVREKERGSSARLTKSMTKRNRYLFSQLDDLCKTGWTDFQQASLRNRFFWASCVSTAFPSHFLKGTGGYFIEMSGIFLGDTITRKAEILSCEVGSVTKKLQILRKINLITR